MTILTGGVVLIVITLALTAYFIKKSNPQGVSPLKPSPNATAVICSARPKFPAPPPRVNTNLFELGDGIIIPRLPPDHTHMKVEVSQHVQTVSENFHLTSDKMTERPYMTSNEPSVQLKISEQPAH